MPIQRAIVSETGNVTLVGVRQVIIKPDSSTDVQDVVFNYRINDGPLLTTRMASGYGMLGAQRTGKVQFSFALPTKIYVEGVSQVGITFWEVYYSMAGKEAEVFRIPFPDPVSSSPPVPTNPLATGDVIFALSTVSLGGYTPDSIYYRRGIVDTRLAPFPSGVSIVDFTFDRANNTIYALSNAGTVYSATLLGDPPFTLQSRFTDTGLSRIFWSPIAGRLFGLRYLGAGANSYLSTYLPGSGVGSRIDLGGPVDLINVKFSLDESNSYVYALTGETGGGGIGIRYFSYSVGTGSGRNGGISGELFSALKHSAGNARLFYNNNGILRYNASTAPPAFTGAITLGALSIVSVLSGSYDPVGDDLYLARTTGVWIIDATTGAEVSTIGTFNCLHSEVY